MAHCGSISFDEPRATACFRFASIHAEALGLQRQQHPASMISQINSPAASPPGLSTLQAKTERALEWERG